MYPANQWYTQGNSFLSCDFSYPRLAPKHPESNAAGIDVFAKFSAYIKNPRKDTNEGESRADPANPESWTFDTDVNLSTNGWRDEKMLK